MPLAVADKVVAPFPRLVRPLAETCRRHSVDERSLLNDGQVRPAGVVADELRSPAAHAFKEPRQHIGFVAVFGALRIFRLRPQIERDGTIGQGPPHDYGNGHDPAHGHLEKRLRILFRGSVPLPDFGHGFAVRNRFGQAVENTTGCGIRHPFRVERPDFRLNRLEHGAQPFAALKSPVAT